MARVFLINLRNMTAIEKRIILDNVDLASLLGMNDNNLKPLEDRFNDTFTVRG